MLLVKQLRGEGRHQAVKLAIPELACVTGWILRPYPGIANSGIKQSSFFLKKFINLLQKNVGLFHTC